MFILLSVLLATAIYAAGKREFIQQFESQWRVLQGGRWVEHCAKYVIFGTKISCPSSTSDQCAEEVKRKADASFLLIVLVNFDNLNCRRLVLEV